MAAPRLPGALPASPLADGDARLKSQLAVVASMMGLQAASLRAQESHAAGGATGSRLRQLAETLACATERCEAFLAGDTPADAGSEAGASAVQPRGTALPPTLARQEVEQALNVAASTAVGAAAAADESAMEALARRAVSAEQRCAAVEERCAAAEQRCVATDERLAASERRYAENLATLLAELDAERAETGRLLSENADLEAMQAGVFTAAEQAETGRLLSENADLEAMQAGVVTAAPPPPLPRPMPTVQPVVFAAASAKPAAEHTRLELQHEHQERQFTVDAITGAQPAALRQRAVTLGAVVARPVVPATPPAATSPAAACAAEAPEAVAARPALHLPAVAAAANDACAAVRKLQERLRSRPPLAEPHLMLVDMDTGESYNADAMPMLTRAPHGCVGAASASGAVGGGRMLARSGAAAGGSPPVAVRSLQFTLMEEREVFAKATTARAEAETKRAEAESRAADAEQRAQEAESRAAALQEAVDAVRSAATQREEERREERREVSDRTPTPVEVAAAATDADANADAADAALARAAVALMEAPPMLPPARQRPATPDGGASVLSLSDDDEPEAAERAAGDASLGIRLGLVTPSELF